MSSAPATSIDTGWLLGLLQASDSLYPTGSYAHSFGLEGMIDAGAVRDRSHGADIGAADEGLRPGAGQHDAAGILGIERQILEELQHLVAHPRIDRVGGFRPVHGDEQHVFADALGQQGFVGRHFKHGGSD